MDDWREAKLELRPIGVVRSPFRVHIGTPRQPRRGEAASAANEGTIELREDLQNALQDVAGFSHLWVLFWFHVSRGWNLQVVPPRDRHKRGLFATRAPHRPNPIGLSLVRLLSVRGRVLRIAELDLLDGTPVLDLKPYVPYTDCVDDVRLGWLEHLHDPGPDHRP